MRPFSIVALLMLAGCAPASDSPSVPGIPISGGDLRGAVRGNVGGGRDLSGLSGLESNRALPGIDAFRLSGINFEHLVSGIASPSNLFSPRAGPYPAELQPDGSVILRRRAEDDPWAVDSTLTYRVVAPCYVDVVFEGTIRDASRFGPARSALFFFASYLAPVDDFELHFRGIAGPDAFESWTSTASTGVPGEVYGPVSSTPFEHDASDSLVDLCCRTVDYPRVSRPFCYGVAGGRMLYEIMLDRLSTPTEEVRFAVFRWEAARGTPAWDFAYVVRGLEDGALVGFHARLVYKPFVDAADALAEYERWDFAAPQTSGGTK